MLTKEEIIEMAGSGEYTFVNMGNSDYSILLPSGCGCSPVSGCHLIVNEDFVADIEFEFLSACPEHQISVKKILDTAKNKLGYSDGFTAVIFGLQPDDIKRFRKNGFCPPYVEKAILGQFKLFNA